MSAEEQIEKIVAKAHEVAIGFTPDNRDKAMILLGAVVTLSAELAKAREVIDKLPKTADGVAVVPGMELWTNNTKAPQHWITAHGISLSPDGQPMVRWQKNLYLAKWFYSSEAAALAAKGPTNG